MWCLWKRRRKSKHIIFYEELNREKNIKEVKCDKIFNGTVTKKLKIARIFKENLEVLENMKK